ncbi:hypothetical protein AKO1_010169 [Acrasis kona]|uniref:Uncharacterized protein n=1 Tax=Acrasis kona TaxID=1008807 RepID=A0AAW2ZR73_9EUKA
MEVICHGQTPELLKEVSKSKTHTNMNDHIQPIISSDNQHLNKDGDRLLSSPLYYEFTDEPNKEIREYDIGERLTSKRRTALLVVWLVQGALASLTIMANVHSAIDIWECGTYFGVFYTFSKALLFTEVASIVIQLGCTALCLIAKKHNLMIVYTSVLYVFVSLIFFIGKAAILSSNPASTCTFVPKHTENWMLATLGLSFLIGLVSLVQIITILKVSDEPRLQEDVVVEPTPDYAKEKLIESEISSPA